MKQLYMKFNYRYLLTFAMMLFAWTSFAQSVRTATGTVLDEHGAPISGITVITIKAPVRGTKTDAMGNFSLPDVKEGEKVRFSFMGKVTVEMEFGGAPMKVTLKDDTYSIEEVLVVAYGQQKKSSFTGSASVVNAQTIAMRPITSVTNALEGVVSGLQIQSTSSAPGSTPEFRIRGAGSINAGQSPLIVVDGVPYESGTNNINPNDVESVTTLKDAASTAIYGARGGNGVILITTKKAASREGKAIITFDSKFAISQVRKSDLYDVITEPGEYYEQHYQAMYNYYMNGSGYNSYLANANANASFGRKSDDSGLGYVVYTVPNGQQLIGYNGKLNPNATLGRIVTDANGNSYLQKPDNWVDETYSTGYRQDYNLNVRGGTEKMSLLASAGYTTETGITDASRYERFTGRLKGTFDAKSWLKLSGSLDVAVSKTDNNTDYADNSNNIFSNASRVAPIYPIFVRDANGNILHDINGKIYDYGDGKYNNGIERPVLPGSSRIQEALLQTRRIYSVKTGAQGAADFIVMPGLTVTMNVAFEERDRRYTTTAQPFYGTSNPGGRVTIYSYKDQTLNLQQLVNYDKKLGLHDIKVTLLHEWYKNDYFMLYASKSNMFSYFENQELAGAITLNDADSYGRPYQSEGYGGRILYNYNSIYHFDVSYRRDASSRFHSDNRWGNFFSLGAGYLLSREDFFNVSWIDQLKIKVSMGQNGNDQIGTTYNRYDDSFVIEPSTGGLALIFDEKGNPDITWETRTAINTGVEFTMLNGRLRGGVEYYYNKTSDMLASVGRAHSIGYSSIWANVGNMRNRGIEIDLSGDIISNRDFKWTMYLNASFNRNKVLKLAEERRVETLSDMNGKVVADGYKDGNYFYGEGLEYKTWRLKKFAGVDDTGRSMWYVWNPDTEELTTTTTYSSGSYFDCGSSQPKVIGGFGGNLAYKSFNFAFAFSYRLGGKALDTGYRTLMNAPALNRIGSNYHKDTQYSWTPEDPSTTFARFQYNEQDFISVSDRWLTKADYMSLQNVSLGYTVPQRFVQKWGIDGLVVSLGVDNLFQLSARKGFVPIRDFDGDLDFGYYPEMSRYMLNISFKF